MQQQTAGSWQMRRLGAGMAIYYYQAKPPIPWDWVGTVLSVTGAENKQLWKKQLAWLLAKDKLELPADLKQALGLSGRPGQAVMLARGSYVYLASWQVQVWLKRQQQWHCLQPAEAEPVSLSGKLEPGDELLLLSKLSPSTAEQIDQGLRQELPVGLSLTGWWLQYNQPAPEAEADKPESQAKDETVPAEYLPAAPAQPQPSTAVAPVSQELALVAQSKPHAWWQAILDRIEQWLWQSLQKLPPEKIYVKPEPVVAQRAVWWRWLWSSVALLLLVILAGGWLWGTINRQQQMVEVKYGRTLRQLETNLRQAETLINSSSAVPDDLLQQAEQQLQQLQQRGLTDESILQPLRQRIMQLERARKRQYQVQPEVIQRLSLIRNDIMAASWFVRDEQAWLLDTGGQRVVQFSLTSKSHKIVAGSEQVGSSRLIVVGRQKQVYLSDKKQVYQLTDEGKVKLVVNQAWEKIKDMDSFGNNLYLLAEQQVWKLQPDKSSVAVWNQSDLPAGLHHLVVDGDIYLAADQQVVRFTRGQPNPLVIKQLPEKFVRISQLYTNADLDNLYLIDQARSSLVVVNKQTGEYQAEYNWPGFGQVVDLWVDQGGRQIWWLDSQQIYRLAV